MTELQLDAQAPYVGNVLGYQVRLATSEADVQAARRLRERVLTGAPGVSVPGPIGSGGDRFDDRCDHLIVWHHDGRSAAQAVATVRLLPPHGNDAAPRGAGLDANREFGVMPLERLLGSTVEAGRFCVHPDHRSGTAAAMVLAGVARYLHLTGYRYLLGVVSTDLADGGCNAAAVWDLALHEHLAPAHQRCRPRNPVAIGGLQRVGRPIVPPLLSGCLQLGAKICGPPAHGEMAGAADFLILLDLQDADRRYVRRFLGSDQSGVGAGRVGHRPVLSRTSSNDHGR